MDLLLILRTPFLFWDVWGQIGEFLHRVMLRQQASQVPLHCQGHADLSSFFFDVAEWIWNVGDVGADGVFFGATAAGFLVLAAAAGGVDFFSFCAAGAFEFPGAASS